MSTMHFRGIHNLMLSQQIEMFNILYNLIVATKTFIISNAKQMSNIHSYYVKIIFIFMRGDILISL